MAPTGQGRPRSSQGSYMCRIVNATAGVDITADLPERISISVGSTYESMSISLASTTGIGDAISKAVGGNYSLQMATKQIWRETFPIEFSLPLIFDAEENSYRDVHYLAIKLQSLALPTTMSDDGIGKGILVPPNPWRNLTASGLISNSITGAENRTFLQLGKQFYFDNVIVVNATYTAETRLNKGWPIAGQIDLTIRTDYALSRAEYLKAASVS